MSCQTVLVADIGGTNARFAILDEVSHRYRDAKTLAGKDHKSIFDAIDAYLAELHCKIDALCFAVAGPVQNGAMRFLNNDWSASTEELKSHYHLDDAVLINDFVANAYSLAELDDDDVTEIGDAHPLRNPSDATYVVIGPGSGLGIAGLNISQNRLTPIASEGGHAGFAPNTPLQIALLDHLQKSIGRVSNERLVSGPGIENIYSALSDIHNFDNQQLSAAQIATNPDDPLCAETMQVFFEILGQVAGDAALSFCAYEGIFVAGGIAQRYPELLKQSRFREGFENKGRHQSLMQKIPSWLIMNSNPGLIGACVCAQQKILKT